MATRFLEELDITQTLGRSINGNYLVATQLHRVVHHRYALTEGKLYTCNIYFYFPVTLSLFPEERRGGFSL